MQKISTTHGGFARPVSQLFMMLIVILLVVGGLWLALPLLEVVFQANPYLNGVIVGVFAIGVLSCFWQVIQIFQSVTWLDDFVRARPGLEYTAAPRLLAPLAALLGARGAKTTISSSSAASIMDSVATRVDEARDITRYLGNLLIFLGLLGTFYGLATTVPAMVDTIRGLTPQEGESGTDVFSKLMTGLESQLGGMGTAFSSSLLGLAGSLVVGLLELFASHGQNRFYRELEDWMTTITRLGFGGGESEAGGEMAQVAAVLDSLAGQMEALQTLHSQAELSRAMLEERLGALVDGIDRLAVNMAANTSNRTEGLLSRMAEGQDRLVAVLAPEDGSAGPDAEQRMRLRSIDVQLLRILEELAAGRQESMTELRADLGALTAAVRQLARGPAGRV
ncbi:biopolymer transporter ExbB [Neogemmobacter tilapiae]|uniref:Biopolymer transporter ExbB n=1 Tax=Neogemmobacter tilapiae TaxID=875041 RepID=A0A918TXC9_9RHOB|nr:biopolymer transporter ExbB [Gemmobacter tilapiae]GHC65988.1 hypothetical protein GCM10007315_33290 [Gemmobacter tilapiae]